VSAEASFQAFGAQRGVPVAISAPMVRSVPLLADARTDNLGPLVGVTFPGGFQGTIGQLAYRGYSKEGQGRMFRFTVASTWVMESTPFVPRLFTVRKGRITDDYHYGIEARSDRLWTESTGLNESYEVTTGPYQDANWMRQLFQPTFVEWLARVPPHDFSFELAYGSLVTSLDRDLVDPAGLDWLCEATGYIAARIRDECLE